MEKVRVFADKRSISLSILCTRLCFVLAFFLIALQNLIWLQLQQKTLYLLMLSVTPIKITTLTSGGQSHQHNYLLFWLVDHFTLIISAFSIAQTSKSHLTNTPIKRQTLLNTR